MTIRTLETLYIDELQDLWSANRQMNEVVTEMADKATDARLTKALQGSQDRIRAHTEHLQTVIERRGAKPTGEHCKGMEGLVDEAREHAVRAELDDDVRDAAIISQFQRMTHYGLAGFGTAKAFATRLGYDEDKDVLKKDLEEIYEGDELFTQIAEGEVNPAAQAA